MSLQLPWTRLYRVSPSYKLPNRRYDLLRGAPETVDMNVSYVLPKRSKMLRLPKTEVVETSCTRFERTVSKRRNQVEVKSQIIRKCERISPENYAAQRQAAKRVDELNAETINFRR